MRIEFSVSNQTKKEVFFDKSFSQNQFSLQLCVDVVAKKPTYK